MCAILYNQYNKTDTKKKKRRRMGERENGNVVVITFFLHLANRDLTEKNV